MGIQFPIGGYLFYVCYGGVIAKYKSDSEKEMIIYFLGVIAFLYVISCGKTVTLEYMNLNVALMAMAIFTFVSRLDMQSNTTIRVLANCTWGIYLIHPLFINILIKVLKLDILSIAPYINLFVFEVGVLICSLMVVFVGKRIPLIRRLL